MHQYNFIHSDAGPPESTFSTFEPTFADVAPQLNELRIPSKPMEDKKIWRRDWMTENLGLLRSLCHEKSIIITFARYVFVEGSLRDCLETRQKETHNIVSTVDMSGWSTRLYQEKCNTIFFSLE